MTCRGVAIAPLPANSAGISCLNCGRIVVDIAVAGDESVPSAFPEVPREWETQLEKAGRTVFPPTDKTSTETMTLTFSARPLATTEIEPQAVELFTVQNKSSARFIKLPDSTKPLTRPWHMPEGEGDQGGTPNFGWEPPSCSGLDTSPAPSRSYQDCDGQDQLCC